jgi:UDP-glucuronate 4-epimerase
MTYLITGAAGFIGFHTAKALLARGEHVLGIDSLDDYYDVAIKKARLAQLANEANFTFAAADIADHVALDAAIGGRKIARIIHLAAQAGVRYSLEQPRKYVHSNIVGHLNMLELARHCDGLEHMVYASSSSVYGGRTDTPFSEGDRVDRPVSLYAATKCADELMSHTYAHLYGISLTGLRFFTVYGPWGRPDMAYWTFTQKIIAGEPLPLFNNGEMERDFTYIDDIVDGIIRIASDGPVRKLDVPHSVYNIGNNRPERLGHFVDVLEGVIGRKAVRNYLPMQPGDVPATYADITAIREDYGFSPKTSIDTGLTRFVGWYRQYYGC